LIGRAEFWTSKARSGEPVTPRPNSPITPRSSAERGSRTRDWRRPSAPKKAAVTLASREWLADWRAEQSRPVVLHELPGLLELKPSPTSRRV